MKSTVAIYDSHWTALNAIEVLKNKNFPSNQLSIIGRAKIVKGLMRVKSKQALKNASESVSIVLGSTLGILSRAGVLAVPGYGFILGAGAVRKVLDGFDAGIGKEGLVSLLTTIGIKKDEVVKYSENLNEGKFLVIAQGNDKEINNAKNILCNYKTTSTSF